jgi:hypothetical protein
MTQNQALDILKIGANVFLTGEPGSGKTHTVNLYIQYLREHGVEVAVTASTGIAATHLGGMTIHSWCGIGIKKELSASDLTALRETKRLTSRVQKTGVLIIDEISMLDAGTLSAVSAALCALRYSEKPFGGIQVVFVGDFFQLPPVVREGERFCGFAFDSPSWQLAKPVVCYLTEQHRHEDEKFTSILSLIRKREKIEGVHSFLSSRKVEVKSELTTQLYSHNVDVDRVNSEKLRKLPGEGHVFHMSSRGARPLVEQLKKSCLSPEILTLKKGARIMFTKNSLDQGFVNGTLGEVVNFEDGLPVVKTLDGREIKVTPMDWEINDGVKTLASITQFPLRLAWAITVHKSQGMTLDAAVMDLSNTFEYGQGYVAISRVRTLSGLFLLGLNDKALEVHPDIARKDLEFRESSQKAENALKRYSKNEILQKHRKFIVACGGSLSKIAPKIKTSTHAQTLALYRSGKSVADIAKARGLTETTIVGHLEKLKAQNKLSTRELKRIIPKSFYKDLPEIEKAFDETGDEKLSPIYNKLKGKYSYDELRLARLVL